jgi:heme ABC exporter ATP-binding subunit CcmA
VSLDVNRGETVALVGPNGAGKTTLIKIMATLYAPSSGSGEILGRPLAGGAEGIRREIALLTGRDHLYGELTGRENLIFALRMSGRAGGETSAERALDRVGLSEAAGRRVRTYSSGMRKRLALARLLLQEGEVVLLDEPYAGLDRDGIALVDRIVAEMASAGRTVVLTTHQPGRAVREADRAILLRRGLLHELPPGTDPLEAVAGERAREEPATP